VFFMWKLKRFLSASGWGKKALRSDNVIQIERMFRLHVDQR